MKIRDSLATINGDKTEHTIPSGALAIIGDDGRSLFDVELRSDGSLVIRAAGGIVKHGGSVLDDRIRVLPVVSNAVIIERKEYKPG